MDMVHDFLTNMYTKRADFVFTVTRDFVRACQTPILVLPDNIPAHPYAVAIGDRASGAEGRGEHLPGRHFRGPDSAGGAPGARLPPGASPADRCPLGARCCGAASAAPRFPQARGRTVRDWGQRGWRAWRARIAWLEAQQSPSRCVRCPRRKKNIWVALKDDVPRHVGHAQCLTGHPGAWSVKYGQFQSDKVVYFVSPWARVKTMSLLSFNLHTLH